jgi:hypothetical protein
MLSPPTLVWAANFWSVLGVWLDGARSHCVLLVGCAACTAGSRCSGAAEAADSRENCEGGVGGVTRSRACHWARQMTSDNVVCQACVTPPANSYTPCLNVSHRRDAHVAIYGAITRASASTFHVIPN